MRVRVSFADGSDLSRRPPLKFVFSPAFPSDARVKSVEVGGRPVEFRIERMGDVQSAVFETDRRRATTFDGMTVSSVVVKYEEGSDVYVRREAPRPGDANTGLRVLRSRVEGNRLRLLLEGVPGRDYRLDVKSPRPVGLSYEGVGEGVTLSTGGVGPVGVRFSGEPGRYVRREVSLPLGGRPPARN